MSGFLQEIVHVPLLHFCPAREDSYSCEGTLRDTKNLYKPCNVELSNWNYYWTQISGIADWTAIYTTNWSWPPQQSASVLRRSNHRACFTKMPPLQSYKRWCLACPHSRPPRERKVPGLNPACAGIFSGSSHTSDLKIGTPVATLPGAWRYRVSTGTGRPGVSILWLGEVERLICNFYLSVAAHKIVWADPSLRYTSLLLGS